MQKVEFYQRPFFPMLKEIPLAEEITVVTASVSWRQLERIDLACNPVCIKNIVYGMFGDDGSDETMESLGWHVSRRDNLHAKFVLMRMNRKYIIYLGSSNITWTATYGDNYEMNVRVELGTRLPSKLAKFIKEISDAKRPQM